MKNLGITDPSQVAASVWNAAYNYALSVQNSSHTPQGAFVYVLSLALSAAPPGRGHPLPGHRRHHRFGHAEHPQPLPHGRRPVASDFMVLNVTPSSITQRRAVVSDYAWYPPATLYPDTNVPKYHNPDGTSNPTAQVDTSNVVPSTDPVTGNVNYRDDGY